MMLAGISSLVVSTSCCFPFQASPLHQVTKMDTGSFWLTVTLQIAGPEKTA
jgi:hypothetical protein